MEQENIIFMGNQDNYTLWLIYTKILDFLDIKILTVIMILTLKKYC